MKTKIERKEEKLSALIFHPDEAPEAKKPLVGLSTGIFIDQLFLTPEGETLNGVPICGQFAVTGLPGVGKSILVEEIDSIGKLHKLYEMQYERYPFQSL